MTARTHWWNTRRLLEPIDNIPPIELEQQWLATQPASQKTGDANGLLRRCADASGQSHVTATTRD